MAPFQTRHKKKLPLLPALILCGAAIALYQIFKGPELDNQIDKVIGSLRPE
jgi:hypothetical protein